MSAGRPSRGVRLASCRGAMAALVGLVVLLGGASAAFAQAAPGQQPTTTTTSPPTTTTTQPARTTTTTSPPTTAPPTTQETAPPTTAEPPPPPDNDSNNEPVVQEVPAEEAAAAEASATRGITFTTVANLLVRGDGTEGAQATTTTTAPAPDEGSSADNENRLIWMIIAGLAGVAVLVAVLTWRYWLLTRPGLVLEGDDAEDVRRGPGGAGYGGAAPPGRVGQGGGRGDPQTFREEPRDPRRAFVGPPETGGAPGGPPASAPPIPGRHGADARSQGARRPPSAPSGQGGPGGRGTSPPPGRSRRPPGPPGEDEANRRRRDPGPGPTQAAGAPPASGGRRRSQPGERDPRGGDAWFRRGQPGGGSARGANDTGPSPTRRAMGRPPGGGRAQPPARPQPPAGGRAMRDTDIWAPDRRH